MSGICLIELSNGGGVLVGVVLNFNRYKRSFILPTKIYVIGGSVLAYTIGFNEFASRAGLVVVDSNGSFATTRFPKKNPWVIGGSETEDEDSQSASFFLVRSGIKRGEIIFSPHGEEIHLFTRYVNNGSRIVYDRLQGESIITERSAEEAIKKISRMRPDWRSPWAYW